MKALKKFFRNEEGQGLAEYGLILALIAVVVILALTSLGSSINNTLSGVSEQVSP